MVLKVLGSGSSGNCYILENNYEAIVIEAGMHFMEVKKALNFNVWKIKAVIITHIHSDHHKYWYEYVKAGIPVFEPFKKECQGIIELDNSRFIIRAFQNKSKDGHWFHGNNDGSECPCYGFYIEHPDLGSLVYVTDTECVRWRFSKVNHILVEANHSYDLIDNEAVNYSHVMRGHMSLQTALDFISTNDTVNLRTVCLLHLSKSNSDADLFLKKARETVKYGANCYIAEKGLEVDLNLCPF